MPSTRRILFLLPHAVGEEMNAVAARHCEMARALSGEFEVALAATEVIGRPPPGLFVLGLGGLSGRDLRPDDVAVVQGDLFRRRPSFLDPGLPVVVDMVSPFLLEDLESRRRQSPHASADELEREAAAHRDQLRTLRHLAARGDRFLCASERQRDFVLGVLLATGRLNPRTYRGDPTFERFVSLLPSGVPDDPPRPGPEGPRTRIPGLEAGDIILYWGGGTWAWTDPEVVIEAMVEVTGTRKDIKLILAGVGGRRSPAADPAPILDRARAAGMLGRSVHLAGWVPYDERAATLVDVDIGISAHRDVAEARFAARSRLLDYIWAGLPVITSEGDESADLVRRERIGEVVPPGDAGAFAAAILRLAGSPERRKEAAGRARAAADHLRWSRQVAPLAAFARDPHPAADRVAPPVGRWAPLRRYARKTVAHAVRGRFGDILRGVRWVLRASR